LPTTSGEIAIEGRESRESLGVIAREVRREH
jgi:hypothetical protein